MSFLSNFLSVRGCHDVRGEEEGLKMNVHFLGKGGPKIPLLNLWKEDVGRVPTPQLWEVYMASTVT